jgi:pyrroloquinoline-quinone synthase
MRSKERAPMSFWDRLDAVRTHCNVLEHPFYTRWSRGELTREELAAYSGQYRHAVTALAAASASAAAQADGDLKTELEDHAAQESAHVDLWDRFVDSVGGDATAAPLPETAACAQAWSRDTRSLPETLAALYAIEAGQPAISQTKRDGLLDLYGFEPGAATEYFDVHATLDHEHAAAHRASLDRLLADADDDVLVAAATEVLEANWSLLDGVEHAAGR